MRTNIGFASVASPLRTLAVVSARPHDGKSTIAANLAIFMAKAGKQTLIIDADLRRPTLHEKFRIPAGKMGLSSAIMAFARAPGLTGPLGQGEGERPAVSFCSAAGLLRACSWHSKLASHAFGSIAAQST